MIYIGTAGWGIPTRLSEKFPGQGTHLERYARILNCVEINSSFYKLHKPETYEKWARLTPQNFRFSVKLSRYFTQEARLGDTSGLLNETLDGISQLGNKWAVLLVQLPPSLLFDQNVAAKFFRRLCSLCPQPITLEPRHISWTSEQAIDLLAVYQISKVIADPEPVFLAPEKCKGLSKILYYRLHGSPEIYKSSYSSDYIKSMRNQMSEYSKKNVWCIFNNTTLGFATENAIELQEL
ncbi:MAG: hypothetical protein K0R94_545 [Burkholderiales bacterium]|nr:hypothetical protein [Burkholderiales bacterium]